MYSAWQTGDRNRQAPERCQCGVQVAAHPTLRKALPGGAARRLRRRNPCRAGARLYRVPALHHIARLSVERFQLLLRQLHTAAGDRLLHRPLRGGDPLITFFLALAGRNCPAAQPPEMAPPLRRDQPEQLLGMVRRRAAAPARRSLDRNFCRVDIWGSALFHNARPAFG